jgi:hypothetical protein
MILARFAVGPHVEGRPSEEAVVITVEQHADNLYVVRVNLGDEGDELVTKWAHPRLAFEKAARELALHVEDTVEAVEETL